MFILRSIGVLSCAKFFAIIQGAIGILIGCVLLIFGIVGVAVVPGRQKFGMIGLLVVAILAPFFYAGIGFVIGALWAFIYNLAARSLGGLELQLEAIPAAVMAAPVPPPPIQPATA